METLTNQERKVNSAIYLTTRGYKIKKKIIDTHLLLKKPDLRIEPELIDEIYTKKTVVFAILNKRETKIIDTIICPYDAIPSDLENKLSRYC